MRRDQIGGFSEFQLFQLFRPLLNPYMYNMIKKTYALNIRGKSWNSWNSFFYSPLRAFFSILPPFREKKIPTFGPPVPTFHPILTVDEEVTQA